MITKKVIHKNEDGTVMEADIGSDAKNVTEDADHRFITDLERANWLMKNGNLPDYDASGTVSGVTNRSTLLSSLVTKMPLVNFLRNVKAGFKLALYAGEIVNNCVTDNASLPLSAAQGKALMDLYNVLNANLGMRYEIIEASKQLYKNAPTPMCNKWLEPGTYLLNTSLRMDLTVQSLVEQLITVGDVTDQNGSAALTLVPGRHFFAHTSVIVVTDTSKNVVLNARYYDGTENLNIVAWLGITKIK